MNKIYDLTDKAKEEGFDTPEDYHRGFVRKARAEKFLQPWTGRTTKSNPVFAFVDRGRWIAKCECGAAEWCAPEHLYWCFECGNLETDGKARPVKFPTDKDDIEAELLKRDIIIGAGKTPIQKTLAARPAVERLGREWRRGEKMRQLIKQREDMNGIHDNAD